MTNNSGELDGRAAWTVAAAAVAILTIAYGAPLIAVLAMKPISAELQTERSGAAAVGAFVYVGAAIGGILAGWLAGRLGVRRIVMFGAVMMAAGLILSASGNLLELYAGHGVLMGLFGSACMFSPLLTYVSRWFERRRGSAIALISSGQAVAGTIWPPLLQFGIDEIGWRRTMILFGLLLILAVIGLAAIFLRPPPDVPAPVVAATRGVHRSDSVVGLSPNLAMALLMLAIFCCCVPMAMPMQHVVAYCGDLGFASQYGAAMLSVLLGTAFLARQFWGWLCDRIGGLQTLVLSSMAQITALTGFLLTQDSVALFFVSSAFGFGLAGLVPAYVIVVREYYPLAEANWRIPTVLFGGTMGMAAGGWGAGLLFDRFSSYLPAFGTGVAFNMLNFLILMFLFARSRGLHTRLMRQPQTST